MIQRRGSGARTRELWRGPLRLSDVRVVAEWYYYLVLAGSVLLAAFRWRSAGFGTVVSMGGLWSLVFGLVFFGLDRYHMPLLPFFSAGAAAGWGELLRYAKPGKARAQP